MDEHELLRLELFVKAMRGDLITRAAVAKSMGHYELMRLHLHNAMVAEDILKDLKGEGDGK